MKMEFESVVILGDFDKDNDVDATDRATFNSCKADPACKTADLNGDGVVDGADQTKFDSCFTGTGAVQSSSACQQIRRASIYVDIGDDPTTPVYDGLSDLVYQSVSIPLTCNGVPPNECYIPKDFAFGRVVRMNFVLSDNEIISNLDDIGGIKIRMGGLAIAAPDATPKPVTKLPLDYKNRKIAVQGFASQTDANPPVPTASVKVDHFSESFVRLNYTGLSD